MLQSMVNGSIDIINKFISELNKIPGVSIEAIKHVTFADKAAEENETEKRARAAELAQAQQEFESRIDDRNATLDEMRQNADMAHQLRLSNIRAYLKSKK